MPQIIENENIILEIPLEPSEELVQELLAEVKDSIELLKPWLPWASDDYSFEDEMKFLRKQCLERYNEKSGYAYLIRDKVTRKFYGCVDIVRIENDNKTGEIGFWLAKSAQGKGYMTKAVLLLEKTAFENGFNRLEIRNDVENLNSVNVAKRAGYHLDGVLRQARWNSHYKKFVDTNVWSKLRDDLK